jgi:hypothetical protein
MTNPSLLEKEADTLARSPNPHNCEKALELYARANILKAQRKYNLTPERIELLRQDDLAPPMVKQYSDRYKQGEEK